jgi:hypothetical protein
MPFVPPSSQPNGSSIGPAFPSGLQAARDALERLCPCSWRSKGSLHDATSTGPHRGGRWIHPFDVAAGRDTFASDTDGTLPHACLDPITSAAGRRVRTVSWTLNGSREGAFWRGRPDLRLRGGTRERATAWFPSHARLIVAVARRWLHHLQSLRSSGQFDGMAGSTVASGRATSPIPGGRRDGHSMPCLRDRRPTFVEIARR